MTFGHCSFHKMAKAKTEEKNFCAFVTVINIFKLKEREVKKKFSLSLSLSLKKEYNFSFSFPSYLH